MKNLIKLSFVLVALVAFASCGCFKKMAENQGEIQVACTPEILTLNNGTVSADITVTFPADYFNSKAIVKVTPVMVFEGGELAGTTKYFQGSKVENNYTIVNKEGGVFTLNAEFAYDARMEESTLQLVTEIICSDGGSEFDQIIANGVNTLAYDLDYAGSYMDSKSVGSGSNTGFMTLQADDYKRVTTVVSRADLLYSINSSRVTKKAATTTNLEDFKANVDVNAANDRATQNIAVRGYASPDGPVKFNDELSKARSETGKKSIVKLLKDAGLDIDAAAYGEDWDGFKAMVEKSNIKDKNLILQVLSLYSSSAQRENEIKNMSTVFTELKEDILPQLRRAEVINTTDIQGKTDAEMLAFVGAKNYAAMNENELLFTSATLVANPSVKVAILDYTAKEYNNARAYNNLGVAQSQTGNYKGALVSFNKAAKLGDSSNELNQNLAIAYLASGDLVQAKKYAAGADAKVKAAIAVAEGNYTSASSLEGTNAAIVSILNNDYPAAKRAIANDKSAKADYLRAVVASKEGNLNVAGAELKSAVAKAPELAEKAVKDVNLINLMDSGFTL